MQRRALGILFACLAAVLVAIAVAALVGAGHSPKGWVIAAGAAAIAFWLASLALSALRSR